MVNTSGRLHDDFIRLLFLDTHRETSALTNELTEESDHPKFRFLRSVNCSVCLTNLEGSVGLILVKTSAIGISIPLDISSRPFIPLSRFIRSRRSTPLPAPSLVLLSPRSV